MRAVTALGLVLIAAGALMLAYPAITYTEQEQLVDFGPLEITTETQESIPIPPVASGLVITAGVGLLLYGRR